jgi:hypothetical protein
VSGTGYQSARGIFYFLRYLFLFKNWLSCNIQAEIALVLLLTCADL